MKRGNNNQTLNRAIAQIFGGQVPVKQALDAIQPAVEAILARPKSG
ncbi:MAG TPA: hypothetical protein VF234_01645 [Limnochordia bacterium]